jgi:hypothetical protein
MNNLHHACIQEHSDRAPENGHDYATIYGPLLSGIFPHSILEIGIGSRRVMSHVSSYRPGAGARALARAFPYAAIFSADIDGEAVMDAREATPSHLPCVFGQCDATEDQPFDATENYDVIIDDGSHRTEDQIATMRILKDRWTSAYIIEDVREPETIAAEGEEIFGIRGAVIKWPTNPMTGDNCVVIFLK